MIYWVRYSTSHKKRSAYKLTGSLKKIYTTTYGALRRKEQTPRNQSAFAGQPPQTPTLN